jgi:hypothetical protein
MTSKGRSLAERKTFMKLFEKAEAKYGPGFVTASAASLVSCGSSSGIEASS